MSYWYSYSTLQPSRSHLDPILEPLYVSFTIKSPFPQQWRQFASQLQFKRTSQERRLQSQAGEARLLTEDHSQPHCNKWICRWWKIVCAQWMVTKIGQQKGNIIYNIQYICGLWLCVYSFSCHICAEGPSGPCNGDSGGPMFLKENGRWFRISRGINTITLPNISNSTIDNCFFAGTR